MKTNHLACGKFQPKKSQKHIHFLYIYSSHSCVWYIFNHTYNIQQNLARGMASESYKTAPDTTTSWEKEETRPPVAPPRQPPQSRASAAYFALVDVVLRFLLFASALAAVLVMVTSKQTEIVPIPIYPFQAPASAKFNHSPAFIYFVAALSAVGFYSIISGLFSLFALLRPGSFPKVVSHFLIFDLFLGVVAAATGTAGGVAYIGLKGNSHTGWRKICNIYDEFCRHIGASIAVSLVASILLALLVLFSISSLSKKIPR
ncbi:CASP 1 [Olea europaea subsp. europaea]|uniref:CASP-like protein n=1 Tax=Olea europaea subsp. europaea TaxID=158383 RepID=A0A8S0QMF4_OLEEU|nr:CASP 1 [Olea europaea subsp. europaea]